MKTAMHRVFRKNLLLLLAITVLFAAVKWLAVNNETANKQDLYLLDEWIGQCNGLAESEIEAYISTLGRNMTPDDVQYGAMKNGSNALYRSFRNWRDIRRLISFAQDKEGAVAYTLPPNYTELLDFYAQLEEPSLINEQPLELYFALQGFDIVPILVLLLGIVFWGRHYEEEIHKLAQTTCYGSRYHRAIRGILLLLSLLLLVGNELIDLACSGMLTTASLWSASVQSYSEAKNSQLDSSIGEMLVFLWCSKSLNVLFLGVLSEAIARKKKNIKDTAVFLALFLTATVVLGNALESSEYYCVLQFGWTDHQRMISKVAIIPSLGISTAAVGMCLLLLCTSVLMLREWLLIPRRK